MLHLLHTVVLLLGIILSAISHAKTPDGQPPCQRILTGTVAEQLKKAENFSKQFDYTLAMECYFHILDADITATERLKALHALAELHEQNDNAEDAITTADLGRSLALAEENSQYATMFSIDLVYAYAAKKDYAKAYSVFLEIPPPDTQPNVVKAQYWASGSRIFAALGFKTAAAELTLKSMEYEVDLTDSDKANNRYNLALILVRDKQCKKAQQVSIEGRGFVPSADLTQNVIFDILDAEVALCLNQPQLAYDLLNQDEQLITTLPNTYQITHRLYRLEAATSLGKNSLQQLLGLESLLKEGTYDSLKKRALLALAKAANSLGLHGQAYSYAENAIDLAEKISERAADNQEVKWSVEYELNKAKLDALVAENQILLQQKKTKTLSWALAVLLLVNALLVLFTHKTKIKMRSYKRISNQDALTGAPNRRAVLHNAEVMLSSRRHCLTAVSIIDLDNFKAVNDKNGHEVGDTVLRCFAQACQSAVRNSDHFGRVGGEEWLVISAIKNANDVQLMFSRIRDMFQRLVQQHTGLDVSFSMGTAVVSGNKSITELLRQADVNLYQVKNSGKDNLCVTELQ